MIAGHRGMRQFVPRRRGPVRNEREQDQGHRRGEAQPREQVVHRRATGLPQQKVADRKADRGNHDHPECGDAEIIADGAADHQKTDRRDRDAHTLHQGRDFTENHRGQRNGKQRLALHDDAGKADRHAMRNTKGLSQELAEEQREADRNQDRPGDGRLAQEQAWQRRDREAQRVISSGENSLSAKRLATKPSPQMTATRMAINTSAGFISLALLFGLFSEFWFLSSVGPALACAADRCRAAARDSRPIPA